MKILYWIHADFELPGAIESRATEKSFTQYYASPLKMDKFPLVTPSIF
jgi:hypothetical protein